MRGAHGFTRASKVLLSTGTSARSRILNSLCRSSYTGCYTQHEPETERSDAFAVFIWGIYEIRDDMRENRVKADSLRLGSGEREPGRLESADSDAHGP